MYKVEVEDLSSVGGSMGTEHTEVIEQKYFNDKNKVYSYAFKYAKNHAHSEPLCDSEFANLECWMKQTYKKRDELLSDMYNIGICITKIKVE